MKTIELGPNQYFKTDKELVYQACRRAYMRVGISTHANHEGFKPHMYTAYGTGMTQFVGFVGIEEGSCLIELTPEQILFANAPDWAVKVVCIGGNFAWVSETDSSGNFSLTEFRDSTHATWQEHCRWHRQGLGETVATRQPEAPEPWRPEIGQECEFKSNMTSKWSGRTLKVIAYHEGEMWAKISKHRTPSVYQTNAFDFRPLRTEREKFGLSLYRAVNWNADISDDDIMSLSRFEDYMKPFDAGFKAPETDDD